MAPVPGDRQANAARCLREGAGADLVVTPELSLTGYDVRDEVHDLAVPVRIGEALTGASADDAPTTVLGLVERGDDGIPYNTAVVLERGRVRHRHRKVYLPTYGVFDEGRWFGRGDRVELFEAAGWRVAILICEDLWHPALSYIAALGGADLLVVPAAAPGRGVLEGGPDGRLFSSAVAWRELVRVTARTHGIFVVLANRSGVEDGITFAGGSMVVGPNGAILAEADELEEERLDVVLDPDAIARARRPFAHWRDEDVGMLRRALASPAP
jgi:predicted amidohydrolase